MSSGMILPLPCRCGSTYFRRVMQLKNPPQPVKSSALRRMIDGRARGNILDLRPTQSINPMQHVADYGPAFFRRTGILSKDPVIVERLDRAVLIRNVDPV